MVPRYPSGNRNVSPIPSYSLDWIGAFGDYRWYTGDDSLLETWWPNILLAIRWFSAFENGDGLLERVPHWLYIDHGAGRSMAHGEILTTLNLQYLAGLRAVKEYAGRVKDAASRDWFAAKADQLASAIRDRLWNGSYYADAKTGDEFRGEPSEVTSAYALLHLEEPGSKRAAAILQAAFTPESKAVRSSPFSMHVILQALTFHGEEKRALEIIRERYQPLLDAGATALWEHWTLITRHDRARPVCCSASHAWGAAPMAFFIGTVLGIKPTEPGWRSVEIRPRPCGLTHASGACLTPHGLVHVEWEDIGEKFLLRVSVPNGLTGKIILPDGSNHPLASGSFESK
jgi:glycogen debranching enzyme